MARRGLRPQRATATLVWPEHGAARLFGLAVAVSARSRVDLFFRVLFARIPNPRPHRPARHSPRRELPRRSGARFWSATLLVRAVAVLVVVERSRAPGGLHCGDGRIVPAGTEHLPAWHAGGMPDRVSFLHQHGPGFCELSVRRHAARGGFHQPIFCADRMAPAPRGFGPTIS